MYLEYIKHVKCILSSEFCTGSTANLPEELSTETHRYTDIPTTYTHILFTYNTQLSCLTCPVTLHPGDWSVWQKILFSSRFAPAISLVNPSVIKIACLVLEEIIFEYHIWPHDKWQQWWLVVQYPVLLIYQFTRYAEIKIVSFGSPWAEVHFPPRFSFIAAQPSTG